MRAEVTDPVMMGRKIVEWTLQPETRPTTFDEFKDQVRGVLEIGAHITGFKLVETPAETLVIRLPSEAPLVAAKREYTSPGATVDKYAFPKYLHVDKEKIKQDNTTPEQLFHGSLGDYTTRECE
jgi:hypothetical protein